MASVWFVFKTPTIIGRLHVLPLSFFILISHTTHQRPVKSTSEVGLAKDEKLTRPFCQSLPCFLQGITQKRL